MIYDQSSHDITLRATLHETIKAALSRLQTKNTVNDVISFNVMTQRNLKEIIGKKFAFFDVNGKVSYHVRFLSFGHVVSFR